MIALYSPYSCGLFKSPHNSGERGEEPAQDEETLPTDRPTDRQTDLCHSLLPTLLDMMVQFLSVSLPREWSVAMWWAD